MAVTEEKCQEVTMQAAKEDAAEVWDYLRSYGPADLEAVQNWTQDQLTSAVEKLAEALSDEREGEAIRLAHRIGELKIRQELAEIQMRFRVEMLSDEIPEWGGYDAMVPPRVRDAMTESQVQSVKKKSAIRTEFAQRIDEGQGIAEAREDLSEKHNRSESTIRDYTNDLT